MGSACVHLGLLAFNARQRLTSVPRIAATVESVKKMPALATASKDMKELTVRFPNVQTVAMSPTDSATMGRVIVLRDSLAMTAQQRDAPAIALATASVTLTPIPVSANLDGVVTTVVS